MSIPGEITSSTLADFCKNNFITVKCPKRGSVTRYERYPECLDVWVREGTLDVLHLLDRDDKPICKLYSLNKEGLVLWYNPNNEPTTLFGDKNESSN